MEALQRQVAGFDDDDGEIHHIENCDLDPLAPAKKEVQQMKYLLTQRDKAIRKQARQYAKSHTMPKSNTSASQQIEELFAQPTSTKKQSHSKDISFY